MRILLDTQVWVWMVDAPSRLKAASLDLLATPENELYLSAASAWEIAIKHGTGRWVLPGDPEVVVPKLVAESRVTPLSVSHAHALRVSKLPRHHGDPFDRLLVAQAQVERLAVMTSDRRLAAYDIEIIAA